MILIKKDIQEKVPQQAKKEGKTCQGIKDIKMKKGYITKDVTPGFQGV